MNIFFGGEFKLYIVHHLRFIKEEADAGSKAMPNKVEKEKLETEKAAPSKVWRPLFKTVFQKEKHLNEKVVAAPSKVGSPLF